MVENQSNEIRSQYQDTSQKKLNHILYDPQREVYHTDVEMTSQQSLCVEVVWMIAEITGTDPLALEPIASVIDPNAFGTFLSADGIDHLRLTFTYEGWVVTVTADGEIVLSESD